MIAVRVELPHLVVKEVLLVLERFRAADVLDEKVSECGGDEVAILRGELDFGLRAVVDNKNCSI